MRKSRFFQKDAYISVDFLAKELEVVRMEDVVGDPDPFDITLEIGPGNLKKRILIDKPELAQVNAIKEELKSFHDSIITNMTPKVSIEHGYEALEVAHEILRKLDKSPIIF
jgi:hypothetical protein